MITTSTGRDVAHLIESVHREPTRYYSLAICSPFLDDETIDFLVKFMPRASQSRCGVRIVSYPAFAKELVSRLPGHRIDWYGAVIRAAHVHAKVYVACARRKQESEAIITSANLTVAGLVSNVEFGIRATASSSAGSCMIAQAEEFVGQFRATNRSQR